MGELGVGELTLEPSGLFAGVVPAEERSNAGVTVPGRPWTTIPSWSSALARAKAYSFARA